MNQAGPCPYCGNIGYHAAAVYLRILSEQNRRLTFALGRYVELCARAADALEGKPVYDALANYKLIDELRKATE